MEKKPSNKQLQEFNLSILKQEHRESGPAEKGYKKLNAAIKSGKNNFLFTMLRHHEPDGVYLKTEIDFRYQTDYLIKFYSLLQIAVMAGYIPAKLPEELRQEIITILNHPAVKKYYEKHYPLLLPQIILKAAEKNKNQSVTGTPAIFRELLLMDYKEDDDVEAFLFLLDGFRYNGKGIDYFNELLSDKKALAALLSRPRKEETSIEKAFWGFIKYNDYMSQYEELLRKCENETFRSAVWHFRGYWFKNMKALMKGEYLDGIANISALASKTTVTEYKRNFNTTTGKKSATETEKFDYKKGYAQWQKDSKEQVKKLVKSISYNLNSTHSKALKEYFKSL